MFKYPVNIAKSDTNQGYVLTCDDIPSVMAFGDTISEVLNAGKVALETAIELYLEDKKWCLCLRESSVASMASSCQPALRPRCYC